MTTRRQFLVTGALALGSRPFLGGAALGQPQKSEKGPGVGKQPYGRTADGGLVDIYTLTNARGLEARVMTLGATLLTVKVPDRRGNFDIVTLHRNSFEEYAKGHPLLGSVVGRYANRIAGARFTLDGVEYMLAANSGKKHHIHGGPKGFQWLVWDAEPLRVTDGVGIKLNLVSPDGQEGYPGTVRVSTVYKLTNADELVMEYTATTDKPTHVNLTNHAYWNLAGVDASDVHDHVLTLYADRYLPTDPDLIPTGELRPVQGTAMDFRQPHAIGARLDEVERKRYDHCYVLRKKPGERLALAARVVEPKSGRVMEVSTTQPGVQFFTGNPRGLCLETQHFPNSPNEPRFPSTVLRPGETYNQVTVHRFGIEK
jgi:aldose 1-epimerase